MAQELCTHYQGVHVLHKHATLADLRVAAGGIPKEYRVMAGLRNPLEMFYTKFSKRNSNHDAMFTEKSGELQTHRRGRKHLREFSFVQRHPDDFPAFFQKFSPRVYNDLAGGLPASLELPLRHHQLDKDFNAAITALGLHHVRPLPVKNATDKARSSLNDVYPETIRREAIRCFGPYMKKWGFMPPDGWDLGVDSVSSHLFTLDSCLRSAYYATQAKRRMVPGSITL